MSFQKQKKVIFLPTLIQCSPVKNCSTLLSSKLFNYVAFQTFSRSQERQPNSDSERQDKVEAFPRQPLTEGYYKNKALFSWGRKEEACAGSTWTSGEGMFIRANENEIKEQGKIGSGKKNYLLHFLLQARGNQSFGNSICSKLVVIKVYFYHRFQIQADRILDICCAWVKEKEVFIPRDAIYLELKIKKKKNQLYGFEIGVLFVDPTQQFQFHRTLFRHVRLRLASIPSEHLCFLLSAFLSSKIQRKYRQLDAAFLD